VVHQLSLERPSQQRPSREPLSLERHLSECNQAKNDQAWNGTISLSLKKFFFYIEDALTVCLKQEIIKISERSAAGAPPQQSAGDAFRTSFINPWGLPSTLNMWRQGCGEWLFPIQSPFSTAGLPAALGGGCVWRIDRGVQYAYIIINSL
jgi:hypothetical protein